MLKTERRTAQTDASKEQASSCRPSHSAAQTQPKSSRHSKPDLKILNEQKETACDDGDAASLIFFPFLPFLSLRFPSLLLPLSVLSFLSFLPEINELQMSGWMLPRSRSSSSYC